MKRFAAVAILAGFLSTTILAGTYYIPHIAGSSAWETYLILTSSSPDHDVPCTIDLYDGDGALAYRLSLTVNAGGTIYLPLQTYDCPAGAVHFNAQFVTARVGYVANEATGGGTAEFSLPTSLHKTAKLDLSNYYDQLTWSGFALFNGTEEAVTVTPRYFTSDRMEHTGTPFVLGPHMKTVNYFENELGQPFTNLISVTFETDSPALAAITISGNENEKLLFTSASRHLDGWEAVDTFQWGDTYQVQLVGQAISEDYLYTAVTSSSGEPGFRNLVKCYDKDTGELVWETALDSDFKATDIIASPSGDYIYLCGTFGTSTDPFYRIVCLIGDTGDYRNGATIDPGGSLPSAFHKKIVMAAGGSSVAVVIRTPSGLTRVLYNENLTTMIDSTFWSMDSFLCDLIAYNGQYYLFHMRYNETDLVYNKLNVFYFPYNSLSGGGNVHDLGDIRGTGMHTHILMDGAFVFDGNIWFTLKVAVGAPLNNDMSYFRIIAAELYSATLETGDLSNFSLRGLKYGMDMQISARISTFLGTDHYLYTCASSWLHTLIMETYGYECRSYGERFINPVVEGYDLYIVSEQNLHDRLPMSTDSNRSVRIRARKTSFTDFVLNGE